MKRNIKNQFYVNKRVISGCFTVQNLDKRQFSELFGGLSRSGFCPDYRIINPRCCYPRKKLLWNRFYEVFATFCGFFGSFYAFGDNLAIADCPKSNDLFCGLFSCRKVAHRCRRSLAHLRVYIDNMLLHCFCTLQVDSKCCSSIGNAFNRNLPA